VRRILGIIIVVLTSGCAGQGAGAGPTRGAGAAGATAGYTTSPVIMAEELQGTRASNLYDAIRRLRPDYFQTRAPWAIYQEPAAAFVVIVNRQVIGGINELRHMGIDKFVCVRRLSPAEVLLISGMLAPDGGIELVNGS